ncbi:MAG: hypothetical protein HY314_02510 [Acidobacteria bacterium]|nr:hypothetical protein [Acidobacteriota bacterium]
MKNIFRVRIPQTVQMVAGNGSEFTAPIVAQAADVPAEVTESVPSPTLESHSPEFVPVNFGPADVAVTEVEQQTPRQAPEPYRSDPAPATGVGKNWVAEYVVPEMEAILAEIQELKQFIQEMEQRKAELERKVSEREVLRNALLTGSGPQLRQAVQYVFSELGVSVQPGSMDGTEIVLEHKGLDFVGEVVACDGPISLANIRQLNHWVEDFIEAHGRQPKGLLIANPFASLPLDARDANGHVPFPEELRLLAEERYRFSLLTTPQLFVAYCKFKEGQLATNEFMTELFETVWVYGNHRDYDRFRVALERA